MKILVAAITFALTLGGLFLLEAGRPSKENYAQVIEALKEGNISSTVSLVPSPIKSWAKNPILTPALTKLESPRGILTPALTQAPIQTLSPTGISISPIFSTTPTLTLAPSPTPKEAEQGFINVTSITSPAKQNSTAQLSISTLPAAQCLIKVVLPSGNQSTAKGLEEKIADFSGNIAWSWKINWNTMPGIANISITCSKGGQVFSKSLQIIIIEK
jgi:hypothetical protein